MRTFVFYPAVTWASLLMPALFSIENLLGVTAGRLSQFRQATQTDMVFEAKP